MCFYIPDSDSYRGFLFPIGMEGNEQLLRIGCGTRMSLQGAGDVVLLQGTILVSYGWVNVVSL